MIFFLIYFRLQPDCCIPIYYLSTTYIIVRNIFVLFLSLIFCPLLIHSSFLQKTIVYLSYLQLLTIVQNTSICICKYLCVFMFVDFAAFLIGCCFYWITLKTTVVYALSLETREGGHRLHFLPCGEPERLLRLEKVTLSDTIKPRHTLNLAIGFVCRTQTETLSDCDQIMIVTECIHDSLALLCAGGSMWAEEAGPTSL